MEHRENNITAEVLIRGIPSILLVFDAEGKLSTWNGAAGKSLGLGEPDTAPPRDELSPKLKMAVKSCMDRSEMTRVDECTILVGNVKRKFGFTANPLQTDGGNVGAIVTGRDITERVRVSEEVDDLRRRAGIEKVARQVAHELRNPLNSIKVHAQFIELLFPEGDPNRRYAKVISEEIDHMDRLLTSLRDLSRAQELDLQYSSPEEAILGATELLTPVAKAKGASLLVEMPPLPPILQDGEKLEQVFVNLLKNAVEAVEPGNKVLVRAGKTPSGGVFVEVLDDGPGVDPEAEDHIFELFFSTKGRASEGVGLALCREIVERHRGSITLATYPEWSTCFRVELPPP